MNIGARLRDKSPCSDGLATRQLFFCPVMVDMNPLLIAGRLRKAVDTILGDFNPFAGPDLGANRRLEFTEVAEDAHVGFPRTCTVSGQIFISGTLAGMSRSASVTAIT